MPTRRAGSLASAGRSTRRTRSALRALSIGRSVARWSPERGSTRSTLARSHRATRRRSCRSVRYAAGTSKRTPSTVTVPSLRRWLRETSVRNARRRASELGRFAADAGAAQVAVEGRLANLGVHLAVVLLLDPGLGGGVEQIERELGLALEHGQQAALDLPPERLLLSVLLGRVRQRRVMDDAEALEAFGGLGGEHGGAVVGEQSAGQPRFWNACDRPCTRASAVSSRYHCKWQQRRERSSRMPSSCGASATRPAAVSTAREPSWKSRCQRPCTWVTSYERVSRGANGSPPACSRGAFARAQAGPGPS